MLYYILSILPHIGYLAVLAGLIVGYIQFRMMTKREFRDMTTVSKVYLVLFLSHVLMLLYRVTR